ncbi:MAG: hypothetical protein MUC50_23580 [Myxococcota bacterium]|nr:hypothetical protein [Myxococcota bacterium]
MRPRFTSSGFRPAFGLGEDGAGLLRLSLGLGDPGFEIRAVEPRQHLSGLYLGPLEDGDFDEPCSEL